MCRMGSLRRKPNLFIIGAAKCGTTSLHHYLSAHPEIFLSEPKEPGYFVPELDYYPRDLDWYLGLFQGASGERWVGESSTHYTKLPMYPGVVDRIAGFVRGPTRFIYLMRDPIDRAISHYWHDVRKYQEHRPIEKALDQCPEYRAIGDYAMQIKPYFDRFGGDAVFTLTFEELIVAPEDMVRSILEWLDVEPRLPANSLQRLNARPDAFLRVRGSGRLDCLARTPLWQRLSAFTPRPLKVLAKRVAYREARPGQASKEAIAAKLRPEMAAAVRRLEKLLGREFPDWTTTFPPP